MEQQPAHEEPSRRGEAAYPPVDSRSAATVLGDIERDRRSLGETIMAPRWFYPLMGAYQLWTYFFLTACLAAIHFSGDPQPPRGWMSGFAGPFFMVAYFMTSYAIGWVCKWRRGQIGIDYSAFWFGLVPRNTVMWVWAGMEIAIRLIALALIVWLVWSVARWADPCLLVAVFMGFFGWFGTKAYDRYFVRLVQRGLA